MTDGFDDQSPEPDFDDPAHAELRDLLASARVRTPIPDEVAARLDAALAGLTGPMPATEDTAPTVAPMRRRSRVGPRLLAAAAVVVVAGAGAIGLSQVMQNSGDSPSTASAGRETAAEDSVGAPAQPQAQRSAPPDEADGGVLGDLADGRADLYFSSGSVPVLTSTDFAAQASNLYGNRLLRTSSMTFGLSQEKGTATSPTPTPVYGLDSGGLQGGGVARSPDEPSLLAELDLFNRAAATEAARCAGPGLARTSTYPIVLDAKPAVLVVHAVSGRARVLQAWSCDGSRVLASTSVPR